MEFANCLGYPWGMTTNGILINDEIILKMKKAGIATTSIKSLDSTWKNHMMNLEVVKVHIVG